MSGEIQTVATVTGLEEVTRRFATGGDRVRASLRTAVAALGAALQRRVADGKLSGQVLHVQSGRLRRSINLRLTESGDRISASVGTNVSYGRFWELGFTGTVDVRAHTRRTQAGTVVMGRRKVAEGVGFVRAHVRRVNSPARPFLRPSLEEMRATVQDRLLAAAREGI